MTQLRDWSAPDSEFPWGEEPDQPLRILFALEDDPILDAAVRFDGPSEEVVLARRALLAAAFAAHLDGQGVSVSFAHDWYSDHFLRLTWATYRNVVTLGVKALAAEGLIDLSKAPPQPPGYRGVRWRSRFTLSRRGLQVCRAGALRRKVIPIRDFRGSRVRLFDRQTHAPLSLPGTEKQAAIEHHLTELSETTGSVTLANFGSAAIAQLPDPASPSGLWIVDLTRDQWSASYLRKTVDRRDSLVHGGRPTGHWAQVTPRRLRSSIRINGMPVNEADIAASHLSIISANMGRPAPIEPYEAIADRARIPREQAKVGTMIMVNARARPSAGMALATQAAAFRLGLPAKTRAQRLAVAQRQIAEDREKASRIIEAVEDVLSDLAPAFFRDLGVRCMAVEADILRSAVTRLGRQGVSAVPMHDGLMIGDRYQGEAIEALIAGSRTVTGVEFRVVGK